LDNSEYSLRSYSEGDENEIVPLFNKAYQHFAGFTPRTIDYWKWCIPSRPNVENEGIVVVTRSKKIVGYAAMETTGSILEFCYNPNRDRKEIVSMLLTWCIDYARHRGAASISLAAPVQDDIIGQMCKELDFTVEPFPALFLKVQDLHQILEKICNQKVKFERRLRETILFDLKETPSSRASNVTLRIEKGMTTVGTEDLKPTIVLESDLSTISACIFGSRRLYSAILKRHLRVQPWFKIPKAVKILSQLCLTDPWYVPGADFG
jgi:hypothetical protein